MVNRERIFALDSLRGIAALGVALFYHYSHFTSTPVFDGFVTYWLHRWGIMLVDLFFVLSGFVLSHVYLEALARREVRPLTFFVLRFSRLYPLHFATLCCVALLQTWRAREGLGSFVYHANDLMHFALNVLFLQQGVVRTQYSFNGPSWSLTVEEVSYIAFFVCMYFFARWFKLGFAVLVAVAITIHLGDVDTHVFNRHISRGLAGFFGGALAFQVHRRAQERGRSGTLAWVAGGLAAITIGYFVMAGYPRTTATLLAHSLVIFPALVLLVLNCAPLDRAFSARPLAYLGEISYSVYMIHFPVQLLLVTLDEKFEIVFVRFSVEFFLFYSLLATRYSWSRSRPSASTASNDPCRPGFARGGSALTRLAERHIAGSGQREPARGASARGFGSTPTPTERSAGEVGGGPDWN